jgi:hypothetical protein
MDSSGSGKSPLETHCEQGTEAVVFNTYSLKGSLVP